MDRQRRHPFNDEQLRAYITMPREGGYYLLPREAYPSLALIAPPRPYRTNPYPRQRRVRERAKLRLEVSR